MIEQKKRKQRKKGEKSVQMAANILLQGYIYRDEGKKPMKGGKKDDERRTQKLKNVETRSAENRQQREAKV